MRERENMAVDGDDDDDDDHDVHRMVLMQKISLTSRLYTCCKKEVESVVWVLVGDKKVPHPQKSLLWFSSMSRKLGEALKMLTPVSSHTTTLNPRKIKER